MSDLFAAGAARALNVRYTPEEIIARLKVYVAAGIRNMLLMDAGGSREVLPEFRGQAVRRPWAVSRS